jgi:hypothetical protein
VTMNKIMFEVYIFVITAAVFCSAGILFGWHTFLLFTNQVFALTANDVITFVLICCATLQTTIEFYMNWEDTYHSFRLCKWYRNQNDKGWRKNICRVLGDQVRYPWYIAILPMWIDPSVPDYPFDLAALLDGSYSAAEGEPKSLIV